MNLMIDVEDLEAAMYGFLVSEEHIRRQAEQNSRVENYSSQSDSLVTQELADAWAITAQKYAGYFYGHPTRAGQYGTPDNRRLFFEEGPWEEPIVFPDDCEFCQYLTPERIEHRVQGFQESIDIEVRNKQAPESLPMVDLPFYLKKRLCIEWNHLLRDFLAERPFLEYDLEKRELRIRDVDNTATEPETPIYPADES